MGYITDKDIEQATNKWEQQGYQWSDEAVDEAILALEGKFVEGIVNTYESLRDTVSLNLPAVHRLDGFPVFIFGLWAIDCYQSTIDLLLPKDADKDVYSQDRYYHLESISLLKNRFISGPGDDRDIDRLLRDRTVGNLGYRGTATWRESHPNMQVGVNKLLNEYLSGRMAFSATHWLAMAVAHSTHVGIRKHRKLFPQYVHVDEEIRLERYAEEYDYVYSRERERQKDMLIDILYRFRDLEELEEELDISEYEEALFLGEDW